MQVEKSCNFKFLTKSWDTLVVTLLYSPSNGRLNMNFLTDIFLNDDSKQRNK